MSRVVGAGDGQLGHRVTRAAGSATGADAGAGHPLAPLPPVGRTFVAGFESTYHPSIGVDSLDTTGHTERWEADLEQLHASGVRHLRYPLRWQVIQPAPGTFDWTATDRVLGRLRELDMVPVVDLVHHVSYPDWLSDGFRGEDFGPAFVRYATAVAERYPWLGAYTLFNEPFATLFLAGHEALWPPYDRGVPGLRRLLLSVLPALSEAAAVWRARLPHAHHVWVDTAEHHVGEGPGEVYAAVANDRRHVVLDLLTGHDLDPATRPFLRELVAGDGAALLSLQPLRVDVLGLDYYCHSEWFYDAAGSHSPSPRPVGMAALVEIYHRRYGLPLMLTETNLRGLASDQTSWLRHTLEQYERALDAGVPLHGYCWFPQVDSADWDSLLARCAGRADPVGVLALEPDGSRRRTSFTDAWEQAAAGAPVERLPAVRFQPPCDAQLGGLLPAMAHWPWRDPDPGEQVPSIRIDLPGAHEDTRDSTTSTPEAAMPVPTTPTSKPTTAPESTPSTTPGTTPGAAGAPDLVVLSHLLWDWVWQRPQHVVSRLAAERAARGGRTWFVEEPHPTDVPHPRLRHERAGDVTRVWLDIPRKVGEKIPSFDDPRAVTMPQLLARLLADEGVRSPDAWLYTPMALDLAQAIEPGRLVYDVMDDLASFKDAPEGMVLRQRRLLAMADVVFTGGPSLHRSILRQGAPHARLFRSGVESAHYARSRSLRASHERPVAGYVGVVDERLDLELLAGLADRLPDWTVRVVGPVAKIDPADLPAAANVEYPGQVGYDVLPEVMAGFDVALMPFALNEATRSISPTKTLEYLAAGLPVVSTRVPDVVADYPEVVALADDAEGFAAACRRVLDDDRRLRDAKAAPLQRRQEWDVIAAEMSRILEDVAADGGQEETA